MDRRSLTKRRVPQAKTRSLTLLLAFGLGPIAGCQQPTVQEQGLGVQRPPPRGDRVVTAAYANGRLEAVLPEETRVPAVIAVAQQALEDRGYTITKRRVTTDAGQVRGDPPSRPDIADWVPTDPPSPITVICKQARGSGHLVQIKVGGGTRETVARSLLDDMLRRLAM
ncbi:MAG: hypothetical protein AAGG07_12480 [Planctomycetota bacterium]